jgi:hypothetical protein
MESNRAAQGRCGAPSDQRCIALAERGRQMADNLAALQRQHAQMGGAAPSGPSETDRIKALMVQLRCGEKPAAGAQPIIATFDGTRSRVTINGATPGEPPVTYRIATPGEQPPPPRPKRENRGFFGALFGGDSAGDDPAGDRPEEQTIDPATAQMLSGSYRTLCVRTCDGYYFPISFNASQGRLRTDANVCRSLCPAAETRLYYHANPGQSVEQAIAADGTGDPLTKLPNAFRYRTEKVAGCTCGTPDPRLLPPGAGGLSGTRGAIETGEIPIPRPNPRADEDPETQATRLSGLVVEPVEPKKAAEAVAEAADSTPATPAKVRIVGPKYFADR